MNNINRRAVILGSIAALAGAAMPKVNTPVWMSIQDRSARPQHKYGDCVDLRPTRVVFGLVLTVHGSGADSNREYGPFYSQEHMAMVGRVASILIDRGREVSFASVAKEVPIGWSEKWW